MRKKMIIQFSLNGNTSGMIIGYDFEFKWKQKTYKLLMKCFLNEGLVMFDKEIEVFLKNDTTEGKNTGT